MAAAKRDVPAEIVQSIIEQIEQGLANPNDYVVPWHRRTSEGGPMNAITGDRYKGINTLVLSLSALPFETNRWATFKQWKAAGASVKKGSKGAKICFYSSVEREVAADGNAEPETKHVRFLKTYTVFNADQVEGWEDPAASEELVLPCEGKRIEAADAFVRASGAKIRHEGGRAFYSLGTDAITMPDPDRFRAVADASATQTYYATLLHELTHWTGAPKRLDRLTHCRFGDPEYAFEELVAELGSVFLCRHLHIASAPRADHARYLASWLKCLNAHPRALFKAAALAQQAVDYLEDKAAIVDQPLAA